MDRVLLATVAAALLLAAGPARAQQGPLTVVQTAPGESSTVITATPGSYSTAPGYAQTYGGYRLEELDTGIRRTRNALIATSALAVVGLIVGATAFNHCTYVERYNYYSNLQCTQRGNALLSAGGAIFGFASIGMITSGIMLGVRKGKRRRLRREMQMRAYGARLQWNGEAGQLEF